MSCSFISDAKYKKFVNNFGGQNGTERSHLEDREKLCAKIDISKE
jgi:hypothetical protein